MYHLADLLPTLISNLKSLKFAKHDRRIKQVRSTNSWRASAIFILFLLFLHDFAFWAAIPISLVVAFIPLVGARRGAEGRFAAPPHREQGMMGS